eukprot:m.56182 g.56182  ORF g.56182 m.56182 type:complete len:774 (-) comp22201_c0_seq1:193-2514(-)
MGRILIKGGVWKNIEDEILKAAVMKYGKNQWSRIASLLHRKTSKQCKARWYEWLDPDIKKTEWSREEEEKLLHLAKLMPTQWRTIAPIIGRTAAQCLEHYERLLDQAQAADGQLDLDNDPRRLRPGEIDPNPHTKPARPDQVDMDEDEKEMLSEARARLANTQGKKAKRKAREKQLEEARRLAMLQKRRELRAAGIDPKRKQKRKRGVDYNAEIPFEKKPARGFFDPTADGEVAMKEFKEQTLEDATGGPRRDKIENQKRKEDKERFEKQQKTDMARAIKQSNKMNDDVTQRKRSKLVLPTPQTTDRELEELVKMSATAEAAIRDAGERGANLLQDYATTPAHQQSVTPMAKKLEDVLITEVQNILALNQTESVLEGGENTPLVKGGGSFGGMTPVNATPATPNTVLSTPYRAATVGSTPGRTPDSVGGTPLRDKLSINTEGDSSLLTPRSASERLRTADLKASLRDGLSNLPKPSSDFDVVVPDAIAEEPEEQNEDMVEDAADVDERNLEQKRAHEKAIFGLQTQVFQRGLPVPKEINTKILRTSAPQNVEQQADEIIKIEMLELVKRDNGLTTKAKIDDFTEEELAAAKDMLKDECDFVRNSMGHDDYEKAHTQIWYEMQKEAFYIPAQKGFGRFSSAQRKDKLASAEMEYNSIFEQMKIDAKKCNKSEKKQAKLVGGYRAKADASSKNIKALATQVEDLRIQFTTFESLREMELQAAPWRKHCLTLEVDMLAAREKENQAKYKALLDKRDAVYTMRATTSSAPALTTTSK